MKDIKIRDVSLVSEVTGNEKIPVSNGSGKPAAVTINLILDKVPEPDLTKYATKKELPTKLSLLTNDANYIQEDTLNNGVYAVTTTGKLVDLEHANTSCIGVAVIANDSKFIINKHDLNNSLELYWGKNLKGLDIPDIENKSQYSFDFTGGKNNTNALISSYNILGIEMDNRDISKSLQTFYESGDTDWYVPSSGLLAYMYYNFPEINEILSKIGGTPLVDTDTYWSSNETSEEKALGAILKDGRLIYERSKDSLYRVRLVRDFEQKLVKERISDLENHVSEIEIGLAECATKEEIPTKVSLLENDSKYLIDDGVDNGVYVLTTDNKIIDFTNTNNDLVLGVVLINDSYKMLIDLYEGKNGRTRTFTLSNVVNLPNIDYDTADGSNTLYYISDFSNFNSLTQGAISDKDGSVNSEALKLLEGDSSSVCGFLRDIAEYDQSDWIVPSCGLLALIYLYKEEINQILDYVGGDLYDNDFYWTCTEKDSESAWCINFTNGLVTSTPKTTKKCRIRAIYNLNVLKPIKTTLTNLETKVIELENKEIPEATIETIGGVKKFEIMDLQDKSNIDNLYKAYNTLVEQMINAGVAEDTRFVDLGLPSGTLWATCNLGSDSIDDPGLFFLWGDIEGYYYKDGLILDLYGKVSNKRFIGTQYKWYDGTNAYEKGTHEGLVKYYVEEDEYGDYIYRQNKLLAEDDASTNYNSNFSIPTLHLVTELLKNTNKSYVDINGKTLLCCESIHNNNKLYLPKIGHLVDTSMGDEDLYFWPHTINLNTQTSCYVYKIVPSGPVDQENYYLIGRHFGLPIRYVKNPQK